MWAGYDRARTREPQRLNEARATVSHLFEPWRWRLYAASVAVFDPITDSCYLIDIDDANANTMTLRYGSAKKESDRINWAADYAIETVLADIEPTDSDPTS
ncbi:hypothetical protein ACOZ4I_15240 [Haloarcula salina]|uniref:hypothetical protein n=1 Tax=Haloarcula salina TaxID=1429914 RepID=UPI003C6EA4D1